MRWGQAAEVIRPAPVQATDHVPPRSVARDMHHAKLQSRILSVTEAVQAAQLHGEIPSEQQAIMLSACGQSTVDCHAQVSDGHTAERASDDGHGFAAGLDARAAPRAPCAEATTEDMCEHSLAKHPYHSFCCMSWGRGAHRIVRSCAHRMLLSQAGRYADISLSCTTGLSRNPMLTLC